ncbi:hypothetical protein RvVAR0630_34620 [Agrobacterium vitis]|nr:hypothetical protein RvVAR0630_34620 [Agrobacterium vitis]
MQARFGETQNCLQAWTEYSFLTPFFDSLSLPPQGDDSASDMHSKYGALNSSNASQTL